MQEELGAVEASMPLRTDAERRLNVLRAARCCQGAEGLDDGKNALGVDVGTNALGAGVAVRFASSYEYEATPSVEASSHHPARARIRLPPGHAAPSAHTAHALSTP